MIEAFGTSTLVVALAEMGDKTQLLAILLAARFSNRTAIALGILFATLANHALAALVGAKLAGVLDSPAFQTAVALGFIIMAGWTLIPDRLDEKDAGESRYGAFLTTLVAFFLVEMGDKTQIATVALGARYEAVLAVTAGTTLGMMIANLPAVWLGHALVERIPMHRVRFLAAMLFLALGAWMLVSQYG